MKADDDRDHRDDEAGPWTRGANIEHRTAGARRRTHPDEGAEGADKKERRKWRRNEIRQSGIDTVAAGETVMAHLVREQDEHQRNRKAQTVSEIEQVRV